jgi:hypothetical protein
MTPLKYLVIVGLIYLVAGLANLYWKWFPAEYISMVYVLVISLPLWIPPIGRWAKIDPIWKIFPGKH